MRRCPEGFPEAHQATPVDAIAGRETRGFLSDIPQALALCVSFITVRKKGKLP